MGDARLVEAVIAGRAIRLLVVVEGGGATLELRDGVAEALLSLAEVAVGVEVVGEQRRGRRMVVGGSMERV